MPDIYFDDISPGEVREMGQYTVTADEIVQFSQQYDPRSAPVYNEGEENRASRKIVASRWHTASICMRLLVDGFLSNAKNMGMVEMRELTWGNPVYAGNTLTVENEILQKQPQKGQGDRGYIQSQTRGYDQSGEKTITWTATNVIARNDGK